MSKIEDLKNTLQPLLHQVNNHDVFKYIDSPDDLSIFLTYYVFTIWDFMSILKMLQLRVIQRNMPWKPTKIDKMYPLIHFLIEKFENFENKNIKTQNLLDIYLKAIDKVDGDTTVLDNFTKQRLDENNIYIKIEDSGLPKEINNYLYFNFQTLFKEQTPSVFSLLIPRLQIKFPIDFLQYLDTIQEKYPSYDIIFLKNLFLQHNKYTTVEQIKIVDEVFQDMEIKSQKTWEEIKKTTQKVIKNYIKLLDGIKNAIFIRKAIS